MSKKDKKKKKPKKVLMIGNETIDQVLHRLIKTYRNRCHSSKTVPCKGVMEALAIAQEEQKVVAKFVLNSEYCKNTKDNFDPIVTLNPLVQALRDERYKLISSLHVWDVPVDYMQLTTLALVLEKGIYSLKHLDLMNCLIDAPSIHRLALSFEFCEALTTLEFDYNDFFDAGCEGLCKALDSNLHILSLSMCYCSLTSKSGEPLGKLIASSSIRDVFLDGNDLGCAGLMSLIRPCVEQTVIDKKAKLEQIKADELKKELDEKLAFEKNVAGMLGRRRISVGEAPTTLDSGSGTSKDKKKKKKRKKKKKGPKEPPPPPIVGAYLYKLHVADNGIDSLGQGRELSSVKCMRLVRTLITLSECLQEIDLEDNLIGDIGGRLLLEALEDRQEAKFPGLKVRTTHRMSTDLFNDILKLGTGLRKKKKKGKKKKK